MSQQPEVLSLSPPAAKPAQAVSFLKHAKLIGSLTFASRIFGLGREIVAGHYMGTGLVASAFTVAFTIPNLFRKLFGEGRCQPRSSRSIPRPSRQSAKTIRTSIRRRPTISPTPINSPPRPSISCAPMLRGDHDSRRAGDPRHRHSFARHAAGGNAPDQADRDHASLRRADLRRSISQRHSASPQAIRASRRRADYPECRSHHRPAHRRQDAASKCDHAGRPGRGHSNQTRLLACRFCFGGRRVAGLGVDAGTQSGWVSLSANSAFLDAGHSKDALAVAPGSDGRRCFATIGLTR